MVRAASPAFVDRATGDPSATLAGREFADFLRLDERERDDEQHPMKHRHDSEIPKH